MGLIWVTNEVSRLNLCNRTCTSCFRIVNAENRKNDQENIPSSIQADNG